MPYIYDMPTNGRDEYSRRSFESDKDHADVELLKLLNGGGYQKSVEPQMHNLAYNQSHGYAQRVDEEEESDVSLQQAVDAKAYSHPDLLTLSSLDSPLLPIDFSTSNFADVTPFADPPFIIDLIHLRQFQCSEYDEQGDFFMNKRYPRMSLNGRAYPPVPPEASTIARPVDDWSDEEMAPLRSQYDMQSPSQSGYNRHVRSFGGEPSQTVYPQNKSNLLAVEPESYAHYHQNQGFSQQQPYVWSPPHGENWSNTFAADFRAPYLHPRLVHLPEQPITPHDTYRYPASHVEQIYVAPAAPEVSVDTINAAFAMWYADQVINLLVAPGSFRPGVGGASDVIWGTAGVERESWLRQGRVLPDYSESWGRMGMTDTFKQATRKVSVSRRRPELELKDPYNVAWIHAIKPSSSLVSFVLDMIQRMTISPTALVSAVWYLHGLGLHEGDGDKGAQLRAFLQEHRSYESESVERRVATLGLILAGKWLDDNSFLTKSWCEVTTIPVKQIDRMERIALADLNFSLHVPVSSWVDHVNKLYASLISKILPDEIDLVVTPIIDEMVTDARNVELEDPQDGSPALTQYERRASADELPAAADQAISRDWGTFARTYGISQQDLRDSEIDVEMERAERDVNALVADEYSEEQEDEEEEEEFLDYDGAKKWLPTLSELKRSGSRSSDTSLSSYDSLSLGHKRGHAQPMTQPFHVPADLLDTPSRQRSYSDWSHVSSRSDHSLDWESANDFLYPVNVTSTKEGCRKCQDCQHNYGLPKTIGYQDAGFVEPGVHIVQPPRYDTRSQSRNGSQKKNGIVTGKAKEGYGLSGSISAAASKRWGKPISAVRW
ncbi:uncharacterized protein I206_104361 [Kwoniella pini CBS 10737]|uniref:Cyclin N-terminal domain-containing protein n=1 Tax=Kwoniella pini CBS 10737 TaxID=1296096 RepID=A0A1B9I1X6_9TREE|nr:uncharacterized protein I206_04060 [Kwoniella pini CBS 10737]OCF49539.1 hypothetical protein I206_04060 [Kwoniella pini CBS 10737]